MDYENGPVVTNNQVNITHPKENGSHADVPRLITELRSAAERSIENGEENLLHDRVEDSTRQYIVRLLGDKKVRIWAYFIFSKYKKSVIFE